MYKKILMYICILYIILLLSEIIIPYLYPYSISEIITIILR